MTDPITFEDVLDELMLEEPKPDYEALVRWQERYPKYRKELADFFATWSVQEHRAQFGPQTPMAMPSARIMPSTVPPTLG